MLSGDLYHYPEERTTGPASRRSTHYNQGADPRRRYGVALDAFLKKNNAQLWIQHDFTANAKLKKAPQYYD